MERTDDTAGMDLPSSPLSSSVINKSGGFGSAVRARPVLHGPLTQDQVFKLQDSIFFDLNW